MVTQPHGVDGKCILTIDADFIPAVSKGRENA